MSHDVLKECSALLDRSSCQKTEMWKDVSNLHLRRRWGSGSNVNLLLRSRILDISCWKLLYCIHQIMIRYRLHIPYRPCLSNNVNNPSVSNVKCKGSFPRLAALPWGWTRACTINPSDITYAPSLLSISRPPSERSSFFLRRLPQIGLSHRLHLVDWYKLNVSVAPLFVGNCTET